MHKLPSSNKQFSDFFIFKKYCNFWKVHKTECVFFSTLGADGLLDLYIM